MCPHSYVPNAEFQEISIEAEKFHSVIRNSKHVGLHGNGEPLVFANLFDYIPDDVPSSCSIGFNTSGQFMDKDICTKIIDKNIGWIMFSIDAGTSDTYKKIRGASWNRLWDNIDTLIELKNGQVKPILYANMILMKSNILEITALVEKLSSKQNFEYLLIYHMNNNPNFPPILWNDKSGNFIYNDEIEIDFDVEYHAVTEAIYCARELNFMLVANGKFLGEIYNHEQM
jgi:wyosine [tRNA(Phe)-imidazoG37] synthetase (radical SAM superfamily)